MVTSGAEVRWCINIRHDDVETHVPRLSVPRLFARESATAQGTISQSNLNSDRRKGNGSFQCKVAFNVSLQVAFVI